MEDEFKKMAAEAAENKALARAKEEEISRGRQQQAIDDFKAKARCLVDVVIPVLQRAKASLEPEGWKVEIVDEARPTPRTLNSDPIVQFSVDKSNNLGRPTRFLFKVTHTKGGLKFFMSAPSASSQGDRELNEVLKTNDADQLNETHVKDCFRYALELATP